MKATKQKNSHARSKRKRKALRMKNQAERVKDRRSLKSLRKLKTGYTPFRKTLGPDGLEINAKKAAIYNHDRSMYDHEHKKNLNQRQRRKRARQQLHGRKSK